MTEMTGVLPFIYSNFLTSKKLKTVSCQSFLSSSGGAVVAAWSGEQEPLLWALRNIAKGE